MVNIKKDWYIQKLAKLQYKTIEFNVYVVVVFFSL